MVLLNYEKNLSTELTIDKELEEMRGEFTRKNFALKGKTKWPKIKEFTPKLVYLAHLEKSRKRGMFLKTHPFFIPHKCYAFVHLIQKAFRGPDKKTNCMLPNSKVRNLQGDDEPLANQCLFLCFFLLVINCWCFVFLDL